MIPPCPRQCDEMIPPCPQPGDKDTTLHPQPCPALAPHQWEFVGHMPIWGDLGTKAKGWEHLVTVVVLDDVPHGPQCQAVGIQLEGAQVVQGRGLRGVPCMGTGLSTPTAPPAPS